MISNDFKWFQMISIAFKCFQIIFQMILNDSNWRHDVRLMAFGACGARGGSSLGESYVEADNSKLGSILH